MQCKWIGGVVKVQAEAGPSLKGFERGLQCFVDGSGKCVFAPWKAGRLAVSLWQREWDVLHIHALGVWQLITRRTYGHRRLWRRIGDSILQTQDMSDEYKQAVSLSSVANKMCNRRTPGSLVVWRKLAELMRLKAQTIDLCPLNYS